jgi:hypothetical protein
MELPDHYPLELGPHLLRHFADGAQERRVIVWPPEQQLPGRAVESNQRPDHDVLAGVSAHDTPGRDVQPETGRGQVEQFSLAGDVGLPKARIPPIAPEAASAAMARNALTSDRARLA